MKQFLVLNGSTLRIVVLCIMLICLVIIPAPAGADPINPTPDLSSLMNVSAVPIAVVWDARTGVPAFIAGQFPSHTTAHRLAADPFSAAIDFLVEHRSAFSLIDPKSEWSLVQAETDHLGMTHVRLQQSYHGVLVLGAELRLHFDASGRWVTAINGDYLPNLTLPTVKPALEAGTALAVAQVALPQGQVWRAPRLVMVDGRLIPQVVGTLLAWQIELYDPNLLTRNVYLVDAQTGLILDSLNRLTTGRNRRTYTAENKLTLPGKLWLTEDGPVSVQSPDEDGINAHLFAGDTYDYFFQSHGRDSFDNHGAALVSTVHYGRVLDNAAWNGIQMVYSDGFASANDVVAHELTHAFTENTANLIYQEQSGALNESISDIFAAMIDDEDWLMGEDLPIGAVRSLSNPPAFGDPEHLDDYNTTCQDNGGVHINSGIPNKMAFLLSEAIGRQVAGQIFYRTLVHYLTPTSLFNDFRANAIQSARDLFGEDSSEVKETETAFAAVGLDGQRVPPAHDCHCAVSLTLQDRSLFSDVSFAVHSLATLYRVRDELLHQTPAGYHYIDLYYAHTGRISYLLAKDATLRAQAGDLLRAVVPGLSALVNGYGDQVVITPAMIDQLQALLEELAQADARGTLTQAIAVEESRLKPASWAGQTFEQVWQSINMSATR